MTIGLAEIHYGFTDSDKYIHKMYFGTQDSADKLGSGGTVTPTDYRTLYDSMNDLTMYTVQYLCCLQEVCQPGVRVLLVSLRQYSDGGDWGSRTIIHEKIVDITGFANRVGNTAQAGPRGRAFIGGRQAIPATNRYGWMRWHYISGHLMTQPALIVPADISTVFDEEYAKLRNVGNLIDGYETLTSAIDVAVQPTVKGLPSSVLHFGIRNG